MAYHNHELPTPNQLFNLAGIGVAYARERRRFLPKRDTPQLYKFLPPMLEFLEVNDEQYLETRHRISGSIGKIAARQWRLRLLENFTVTNGSLKAGVLTTYAFEWSDKETLESIRATKMTPVDDPSEFIDFVEGVIDHGVHIDPEMWHAEMECATVTAGDCEVLINDVDAHYKRAQLRIETMAPITYVEQE